MNPECGNPKLVKKQKQTNMKKNMTFFYVSLNFTNASVGDGLISVINHTGHVLS